MTNREEMRSLAEEIVRSYKDRIKVIPELRRAEAGRKRTEAREIAQRRSDVGGMLKGVGTMLKGFDDAHATVSKELKADLAKVTPALREAEDERKRTEAKGIAQRKSEVDAMLKGFDDAHATVSKELKADLAKVTPALREAEDERKRTEAKGIAQRKSEVGAMLKGVGTMLKGFREEQAGARFEWQKMTATVQSKRGGVAVAVKPLIEEIAERAAEITPETAAVREQIFEYLANHPDGTKLVDLAEEFGIARIQIAKVVRNLMDENKVEKRDLLYFAV